MTQRNVVHFADIPRPVIEKSDSVQDGTGDSASLDCGALSGRNSKASIASSSGTVGRTNVSPRVDDKLPSPGNKVVEDGKPNNGKRKAPGLEAKAWHVKRRVGSKSNTLQIRKTLHSDMLLYSQFLRFTSTVFKGQNWSNSGILTDPLRLGHNGEQLSDTAIPLQSGSPLCIPIYHVRDSHWTAVRLRITDQEVRCRFYDSIPNEKRAKIVEERFRVEMPKQTPNKTFDFEQKFCAPWQVEFGDTASIVLVLIVLWFTLHQKPVPMEIDPFEIGNQLLTALLPIDPLSSVFSEAGVDFKKMEMIEKTMADTHHAQQESGHAGVVTGKVVGDEAVSNLGESGIRAAMVKSIEAKMLDTIHGLTAAQDPRLSSFTKEHMKPHPNTTNLDIEDEERKIDRNLSELERDGVQLVRNVYIEGAKMMQRIVSDAIQNHTKLTY
ncbi:hypothetical protein EDB80DRAFT_833444 [Ilyonectria destructans]|nr:hypothetical protein EDB80DRAFT_833444 [Ilyonectria destructans]